jgi:hypothetical protein
MYQILKQLNDSLTEVTILLSTQEWIMGFITFVNEEYIAFEAEERDEIYYTLIVKLDSICAVEFVSDFRINNKEKLENLKGYTFVNNRLKNKKDSNNNSDDDNEDDNDILK